MRAWEILENDDVLNLNPIKTGDTVYVGKFKNRKAEVKGFETDDHGQPVLNTTKGKHKLFKPRIDKLKPKNLDEGSHEDDAEAYAAQHGLEIAGWEGSGDMGEAYVTNKNTIIKVTTDKTEMAMAAKLVGQTLSNVADVYDVQDHIIHMEYLDTTGVDDVYGEVSQYDNGDGVEYIDADEHEGISEEAIKMIQDLSYGIHELGRNGIQNLDIKDDNIGKKPNGDYAMFDMSDAKRGA